MCDIYFHGLDTAVKFFVLQNSMNVWPAANRLVVDRLSAANLQPVFLSADPFLFWGIIQCALIMICSVPSYLSF